MTLIKTGFVSALVGLALALIGSRTELQAINRALTRRLKTGIALVLAGIVLALIGLRLEGQNVFRRLTGRHRGFPYIEW